MKSDETKVKYYTSFGIGHIISSSNDWFFFRSYHLFLFSIISFFYDLYFSWRNLLALWLLRNQSIAFQRRQICEVYYTLSYNERDIFRNDATWFTKLKKENCPREIAFIKLVLY